MKNKYKVVALVPLEFSVEGSSDSKEAIESVKNIFEACRDDNDCAEFNRYDMNVSKVMAD